MRQVCRCAIGVVLLMVGVAVADEGDFDESDRRKPPRERDRQGPQLPPPLRVFDEDHDGALSADEIQGLADRLNGLDQDGDGLVDARELGKLWRRPPHDRREEGRRRPPPRDRQPFDDEFDDDRDDRDRTRPRPPDRQEEGRRRPPPRDREPFDDEFDDARGDQNRFRPPPRRGADQLIDRVFQYDTNRDGQLSGDELSGKARRLLQADVNGDEMISREELERFFSDRQE